MSRTIVIYHRDCADGMAAAWAAFTALGRTAEYVPMGYDEPRDWAGYTGADVNFVDFSWPRADLEALATVAETVTVLDHHKTAKDALSDIPLHAPGRCPIEVVFNMEKSGARLSWEHFRPGVPVPPLVSYVEDRDLWLFKLPGSKEVSAALRTFPLTIEAYDQAAKRLLVDPGGVILLGERVLALQQVMVEGMVKRSYVAHVAGLQVPVCNVPGATMLQSEVGDALCKAHPDMPFAATYADLDAENRGWSLRSRPDKDGVLFDCSAVARMYGGGGHPGAAGFTLPAGEWPAAQARGQ